MFCDLIGSLTYYIVRLFEVTKKNCLMLAWDLINLLDKFGLRKKIIAYVKNESSNLNAMTSTLKFVVNYEILGLHESFNGYLFMAWFFQSISIWYN
jgi:hypothetical protein